jgi:hypothetical protein
MRSAIRSTVLIAVGLVLASCESNAGKATKAKPAENASPEATAANAPASTIDSANLTQVVLEVPGMT